MGSGHGFFTQWDASLNNQDANSLNGRTLVGLSF